MAQMEEHPINPDDFKPEKAPALTFSDEAWNWFLQACADLELTVSQRQRDILEHLYSHLSYVNEWLNLTRITDDKGYLKFHVFDSLTVLNLVQNYTTQGDIVLDLGSGGGYPGLPLMTWLPDRHFVLVDSRPKKVMFLSEAVRLTDCRLAEAKAFRGREVAHFAPELHKKCKIVTARAVGKAAELLLDAKELLEVNGIFLCLKGQSYPTEERKEFLKAMPRLGFTLLEEHRIALDESDPDRWAVLALKTDEKIHRKKG
ncbi:MAG: 16S rRNA (guanine(527)-N(7))-methyltransferase RsmG [Victivallales bacterium]|nr:16S rRNA (guanine(527)-N(7))-methyltransferase RsmG [Victivallales bacterium]